MLQQLSYFQNSEAFSLPPLLNKDQRKNNITDTSFSIWQNIFQTMDFFLPAFSITKSLLHGVIYTITITIITTFPMEFYT